MAAHASNSVTNPRPMPARAGIGLRAEHHAAIIDSRPDVGWLEAHSENYFASGGASHRALDAPGHQVGVRRLAVRLPELAAQVTGGHVRPARECLDVERLGVVAVDPVLDAAQPGEVAQPLLLRRGAARHMSNPATPPSFLAHTRAVTDTPQRFRYPTPPVTVEPA